MNADPAASARPTELLSTTELAREIGVDESKVHYAARRHVAAPACMIANRRLWSRDSIAVIRAFLAERAARRAVRAAARRAKTGARQEIAV